MEGFDYEIIHVPGIRMKHVDALNRNIDMISTQFLHQVDDEVMCKIANSQ